MCSVLTRGALVGRVSGQHRATGNNTTWPLEMCSSNRLHAAVALLRPGPGNPCPAPWWQHKGRQTQQITSWWWWYALARYEGDHSGRVTRGSL